MQLQLAIMRGYIQQLENGSKLIDTELLELINQAEFESMNTLNKK